MKACLSLHSTEDHFESFDVKTAMESHERRCGGIERSEISTSVRI